ncbi:MAG: BPSS1780 family membrane protein [Betaproteobacteria bacterium]
MRAQTLPAMAGWRWLVEGFAIYRRNPALLLLIVFSYWIALILVNLVPILGPVVATVAMPAFAVGVMNACRELDEGRLPPPGTLLSGFRTELRTLLILGVIYLVLTIGILFLSALLDDGAMMRFLMSGKAPSNSSPGAGAILAPLIATCLLIPLLMAYWFAPMLAAWHRLTPPKALFFSLVACWINWRAFMIYGLALLVLAAVLPAFILLLGAIVAPGAVGALGTIVSVPLLVVLMPVVFASFYASYRGIFRLSEQA